MATRIIDLLRHPVRALQEWQRRNLASLERDHDDDASDPEHETLDAGHDPPSHPTPATTSPNALFRRKLNTNSPSENLDPASQRAALEVDVLNLGNNVEHLIERGLTKPKENHTIHADLNKLREKHQTLHLTLMTQRALFVPQYQHQFDDLTKKLVLVEQQIARFVTSHTLQSYEPTAATPDASAKHTFANLFTKAKPESSATPSSQSELKHQPSNTPLHPKSKN